MICIIRRLFYSLFQKDGLRLAGKQLIELFKYLFGIKQFVYFDFNATTMVDRKVRNVMNSVVARHYGNPSSLYESGQKAAEIIDNARIHVAEAIGADKSEVYFTGCATESNNAVLKSLFDNFYPRKKKIIALPIEHPSIIKTLEYLETKGAEIAYCPVDHNGSIIFDALERLIDESTFLICCMLANNEIGTIQNVRKVVDIASERGVPVHSDCVQAFGKIPVNVRSLGVNYASFSAHKVYGPKGIGALYVKIGSPFTPFVHGGHQEQGLRAGTEGVHNIAGFGEACLSIEKHIAHAYRLQKLKDKLIKELKTLKPDCIINSPERDCLPNTINVTFPNIKNGDVMAMLNYYGVEVSAGSACSSSDDKPSYVLKKIGLSDDATRETVRISMGSSTSEKDVHYMLKVLKNYFNGKTFFVNSITSNQLDEKLLLDDHIFMLDIRPEIQRKKTPGLPNWHQILYRDIEKDIQNIPNDKHIIVVCENGQLSLITAYNLKSRGYHEVSSLKDGIKGWKIRNESLYKKYL
jgi:cysteine desulfurase